MRTPDGRRSNSRYRRLHGGRRRTVTARERAPKPANWGAGTTGKARSPGIGTVSRQGPCNAGGLPRIAGPTSAGRRSPSDDEPRHPAPSSIRQIRRPSPTLPLATASEGTIRPVSVSGTSATPASSLPDPSSATAIRQTAVCRAARSDCDSRNRIRRRCPPPSSVPCGTTTMSASLQ